jgi:hypothetical protein
MEWSVFLLDDMVLVVNLLDEIDFSPSFAGHCNVVVVTALADAGFDTS